ncbi:dienelactone hydrolase family protein [Amorphus coralli]|uniref:dienelactone hydrolase family protein n=1 Tax=Amorphus coralli TaxID=340680 RepID=UPI00041BB985|nr:dienelactone hydrolase family protein [Amorphus coralli]
MTRPLTLAAATLALAGFTAPAFADIVTKPVEYTIGGDTFEGYFAINDAAGDDQPLVIIVHDWDGLTDYEKRRAEMLAEMGYAAFAVDVYGKGVRPTTLDGKKAESGKMYQDRETFRQRLMGGLDAAEDQDGVSDDDVAVIGYCFGGAAALEMARAGAEVEGFVSFHGGLGTPEGQDYSEVDAPILILHGSADPAAPMSQVAALVAAMDEADVDFEVQLYSGARHSFTEWSAKGDTSQYDAVADRKSWQALLGFLNETIR